MFAGIVQKARVRLARRDEMRSEFLRDHYRKKHDIDVGLYSYGCFDERRIGRNTRFGRYCSVAPTAYVFRRNHGIDYLALHPFLYSDDLAFPVRKSMEFVPCDISDDVWLGHNSVVLPSVRRIGRGAVVGAGAVVTRDVDAYSVVVGNPARALRRRFDESVIESIEATKWWTLSESQLAEFCAGNPAAIFSPHLLNRAIS